MNTQALLDLIVPILGQTGADALKNRLEDMTQGADALWKRAILALVGDAIQKHGVGGIQIAVDAVRDILNDKYVDIDWAHLDTASDLLAHMQNAEAGRKSAARSFLTQVGEVLGIILAALVKSLIK